MVSSTHACLQLRGSSCSWKLSCCAGQCVQAEGSVQLSYDTKAVVFTRPERSHIHG